jgi:hypothetical protein
MLFRGIQYLEPVFTSSYLLRELRGLTIKNKENTYQLIQERAEYGPINTPKIMELTTSQILRPIWLNFMA